MGINPNNLSNKSHKKPEETQILIEAKNNDEKNELKEVIEKKEIKTNTKKKVPKNKIGYKKSIIPKPLQKTHIYEKNPLFSENNFNKKLTIKSKDKKNIFEKIKSLQKSFFNKKNPSIVKCIPIDSKIPKNINKIIKGSSLESTINDIENQTEKERNNYSIEVLENRIPQVTSNEKNIILPVIVIEDEYYEKIINFINLKNEKNKEETNKKSIFSRKMKRNLNAIKNFNLK